MAEKTQSGSDSLEPVPLEFAVSNQLPQAESLQRQDNHLQGWRLWVTTAALLITIFLPNFEISIVGTSLVAITNELHGFDRSSWVVTAYLLTYTAFFIIWAKLSNIIGRKSAIITAVSLFAAFSGACGAAQTFTQLVVCRAFQGLAGSGAYSMTFVIVFELVPPKKYAQYTSLISSVFVISLLLGPILGGVINDHSTWRWVFLLNVPAGALTITALYIAIPPHFPNHGQLTDADKVPLQKFVKDLVSSMDFIGALLMLLASIILVSGLQLVGSQYRWSSPLIVILLAVSGPLWIGFLVFEKYIANRNGIREPIFPWTLAENRVFVGMLANAFFVGAPFTVTVVEVPFRYQTVNGLTPFAAGLRLLPFTLCTPISSAIFTILVSKSKIAPIFFLFGMSLMTTLGYALLSTIPLSQDISSTEYIFEALIGLGTGGSIGLLTLMTPYVVAKTDKAVAIGAVTQFRMMGGAIGLAIVTAVMNSSISSNLSKILTVQQLSSFASSSQAIESLPAHDQAVVRAVFAEGTNIEFRIMIGFCAAQLVATLLMWQKQPTKIN